ncbi:MAG: nucleotide exchange factor GrpE [Gemmatimonadota bacterium]
MTDKEKDFPQEPEEGDAGFPPEDGAAAAPPGIPPEAEDEVARLRTRLAYLAAEFDNYRKRSAREKDAVVAYGNERLLRAILPFLDNLERAISQADSSRSAEALIEGVRLTYDHFLAELRKFGLTRIAAEGEMFDPNLHEAIAMVPWEGKAEGTVLAENRRGYLLNGRLLRPAQVTVAQAPRPAEAGAFEEGDGPDRGGRES